MPLSRITAASIADGTVVAADIADGAVTGPKLGATSINANNIVNATITGAKIATGQITGNLLTANCVSGNNIVSGVALTGNVSVTGNVTVGAGTVSNAAISTTGDTNTGIFFPGADRIGFAEGGAQCGEFDASGNFQFNSGYGSVATAYGCRAWVNFNGTGVVAIRASGNVSSITDNGTGDYTVNFTTAMPDANYSAVASSSLDQEIRVDNYNTGTVRVVTDTAVTDAATVSVAIFR